MAPNCQHFQPLGFGIANTFAHGPFGFYLNTIPCRRRHLLLWRDQQDAYWESN